MFRELQCGGLYIGGGGNSVPLPVELPDRISTVVKITGCSGTKLTLAGTTAAEVSDARTCTTAGCPLGPPIPVPNEATPPSSVCLATRWAGDATGVGDCARTEASVDMELSSDVFLSGDLLPSVPGVQPCPLCFDGACHGGPNDGHPCTSTSSLRGNSDATSVDCPPPPEMYIGQLTGQGSLTTGTVSWTAVEAGAARNAFCGFCRDADGTGAFQSPPVPCLQNGARLAACTQPFESCEPASNGAFGPAGGGVSRITLSGNPPRGALAAGTRTPANLVELFCIPPTFNPTLDGAADLPGAGALTIRGTFEVLP